MLVLSRYLDEKIVIGSGPNQVVMTVIRVGKNNVKLAFEAPKEVAIDRMEIRRSKERKNG